MSPRRSPRFKKLSPKPELPKKPRQPKRVENPIVDSVRQANYQVELAAWQADKEEHENLMQRRKGKQNAASMAARAEKLAPPPAAPPAALAPPPQLSADEARLVGSPALAEHRVFEILTPAEERFPRLRRSLGCGGRSTSRRWRCVVELAELKFSTTTVCGSISRSMEV